jgi:hypothetical protein
MTGIVRVLVQDDEILVPAIKDQAFNRVLHLEPVAENTALFLFAENKSGPPRSPYHVACHISQYTMGHDRAKVKKGKVRPYLLAL